MSDLLVPVMIVLFIWGLIGIVFSSDTVNKAEKIRWKLALFLIVSLYSLSLALVYFLGVGVAILVSIYDPISGFIQMDIIFMEMLVSGFGTTISLIFMMTYCCTSISGQKSINFKHLIASTLLFGFSVALVMEVLITLFLSP
ncbi:hypothetical protein EU527_03055 [Candidatus Thorarchaeota archaeon]|nr:MAG: hypothetical protein EU527_03055 [Candidatus Thorarchaeota archaeon]